MPKRTALKPVVFRGDSLEDAVHVLHCFQKKTEKTAKADLKLARTRYRQLIRGLK